MLEYCSGAKWMGFAIFGVAIMNNLPGGFIGPGNIAGSRGIRLQQHIAVYGAQQVPVVIGELAGNGLSQNALW